MAPHRIELFDALRGWSVVSMVGFHFCYDLTAICGIELSWFTPPFEDIWRASISWMFLLIAGVMCSFSRSNAKRGLKYAIAALAIWVVTSVAGVDVAISFGIIFCMAASTLLYASLDKLGIAPKGLLAGLVLFVTFLATLHISRGTISLFGLAVQVPNQLYETEWLSWLGFPGPHFSSGDYYPLLPYSLLFMAGASWGHVLTKSGCPDWFYRAKVRPLNFVGRHALEVYIAHQPILLVLSLLIERIA